MSWQAPPWRLMNAAERRRYWWGHWRLGVPVMTTVLMLFIMTVPLIVPAPIFPHLGLLAIFVWSTFQPGLLPAWAAFLLGLVADLLFGQPLGVNAVLFPMTAVFVRVFEARFGRHAHGFDWAVASATIIGFELLTWQFMAVAGKPVPLAPLGWQVLTSIAAYPVVVWVCGRAQRAAFGWGGPGTP